MGGKRVDIRGEPFFKRRALKQLKLRQTENKKISIAD
jgi:hypothetical protein